MKKLKSLKMSGKEVLPIIEGGKGIAVSSGKSSGAWAKAGGIGTFSGVNADSYDKNGNLFGIFKTYFETNGQIYDLLLTEHLPQDHNQILKI